MKKKVTAIICINAMLALAACGGEAAAADRMGNGPAGVEDVLQERMAEEQTASEQTETQEEAGTDVAGEAAAEAEIPEAEPVEENKETAGDPAGIDVDLTELSATMIYSEVSNMMTQPDDYIGKTIKMEGAYSLFQDPDTGKEYRACIIQDATACCAQGIEFETDQADKCPAQGEDVTVVGVFDTYYEGEYLYCTLRDARVL